MIAPALLVAVPLVLGVAAGAGLALPRAQVVGSLVVAWLACGVALWRSRALLVVVFAAAGFAAAGAALGTIAIHEARHPSLFDWFLQFPRDGPVRVSGVLREDARISRFGVSLLLLVREVDRQRVNGGLRLTVAGATAPAAAADWRAGRQVAVQAAVRLPLDYRNPGVPSDRERLLREGIVLLGSVKSAALVTVERRGSRVSEAAAALRAFVRGVCARAIGSWSPRSSGVATAILIGDRGGLDPEDERRLQEGGTYHVIAISGGNIALLTALLVLLGRGARLPPRTTAAASIGLLAFYGYTAGLAPSVLRATLAGGVYLAGRASDHRGAALNAVGVAAATAAAAAPLTLLDPGFVLSFGATLAIVIGAPRVAGPRVRDATVSRPRLWAGRLVYAAKMLFAATVCAELALAPVGARLFGRVSVAGLLLNFAAIPLMSVIQIAGLAAVAGALVSGTLAAVAGFVAHLAAAGLLHSARLVDAAPWLVRDVPPPAWWLIAGWYAGLAAFAVRSRRAVRAAGAAALVLSGLLILAGRPATRAVLAPSPPAGWTRLVFLDVGQADATLILPPDCDPMFVDAGGIAGSSFDVGRRVTLPAAWAFGVIRSGPLVLTHGDPDHVGGAPAIVRALRPSEVWDGIPVPPHEPMRRLRELARRYGVPWTERRAGQTQSCGSLRIQVLNPPAADWERRAVRNDDSIVLHLRLGDVGILLPGDITRAVEPGVIARLDRAPLTIVKAPHHGSAGSSSPAFVDALRPAAVIFSAGLRNPFGHPAPAVVQRYRSAGAEVFSTAEDGAVVVETDGREVLIWTWVGKRATVTANRR
ncbi:MAG TPA: ComEC/Rec2 family competence protein [Vicinamibacterales bacterium]|nr:ComEC/Rec2 family competence protein [Vicinamibacterales bacterium]